MPVPGPHVQIGKRIHRRPCHRQARGTGSPAGYGDRVGSAVAEHADGDRLTVGVSGYTHQRMDEEVDGYRVLNPGSATGAAPASDASMMVADVADGGVSVETRVE